MRGAYDIASLTGQHHLNTIFDLHFNTKAAISHDFMLLLHRLFLDHDIIFYF